MKETLVIDATRRVNFISNLKECWHRRDLILMLFRRDMKVRYAQTVLGFAWALLNPVISILLLLFVFNVVAKVNTFDIPPILFITSGLCAWNYFSRVVAEAGDSIIGAQSLVKKIYFPRLVIPFSKALGGLPDFIAVFIILIVLSLYYHVPLSFKLLWILPILFMLIMVSLGCGIWISALSIRYRDFHFIVPVLLRLGMFVSPVAYGTQFVPAEYKWIVSLNPVTGIIDLFRWMCFGLPMDPMVVMMSLSCGLVLLVSGLYYFVRMEKYIADII